jgi:Secretion system C-terminal sorting domain
MNKLLILIIALIPGIGFAQTAFLNEGGQVYIQKGALLSVQGDFSNQNKGTITGSVQNDGIIEVSGNFNNAAGSVFTVYNDNTSTDRAVKFIGSGTQTISGSMNTSDSASFYNMVIDKTSSASAVQMSTDIAVAGSLVFGTSTLTSTYNPSNLYTDNEKKGVVLTYIGSNEYSLNVTNGKTDAIAGYPAMAMNESPTTGFILTSGTRGTANGGLQRHIASATSYEYPIGTVEHGFNAIRMNFTSVPAGGGMVKGKFNDGSDNPNGAVGTINQQCVSCTGSYQTPGNNGYNQYFASNPCNNDAPQWVVLQDAVTNHGYWSFGSADNNQNYKYSVEAFPNTYTASGNDATDIWRTLIYKSSYGFNPSASNVSWNEYIDSVSTANDMLEYSRNTGACYTGNGIPGGSYSGFGQFALKKSNNGDALPVKLLYVNAAPAGQQINVTWSTALEINNNGFEVERSTDGVNYTNLGFVQGHNNSTVTQSYAYADINAQANTVYYYRLNQIDNNGNSALSYVVSAEVTGGAALTISDPMPNPATSASRIMLNSTVSMDINVKIYSVMGQMVSNMPLTVNAGDNIINLEIAALNSGNYNAVIEAGNQTFIKSIIVTK